MKKRLKSILILLVILTAFLSAEYSTTVAETLKSPSIADLGTSKSANMQTTSTAADFGTLSGISSDISYSSYDYVIDSYNINVIVNEDNTLNITEQINAYFNVSKHGIYRKITIKNTIIRQDGKTSYYRAKVSDIKVDSAYSASIQDNYKVLQIGDASKTIIGAKTYNISYTYDIGKDTGKNYDELYFDLIGTGWDTVIGNVTFTITMPKEFDQSRLGFSSGSFGTADSSNVTYSVSGNVIKGSCNKALNPEEALTVRLELPDGYFVVPGNINIWVILSMILPVLFVMISAFLWYRFGKDEPVIETVEFYPPEGLNSADVGFIYKGSANRNDVISLLVYLANEGYLKISEEDSSGIFSKKKSFRLTKLKDYSGNNENESLFMEGLFKNSTDGSVTADDLQNHFYSTLSKILKNLNSFDNLQRIFEKSSLNVRFFPVIMIIATFVLITVQPVTDYSETGALPYSLIFPGIGFSTWVAMFFGKTPAYKKIFGLFFGLLFGGIPLMVMVLPALLIDTVYLIAYINGLICVLIMILFVKIMRKRTLYGNAMLGKIRGFRNFLEMAERPKLEALVMENPDYFYNILPYTYALGLSDKWIKKFEVIAIERPDWYESNTAFNIIVFSSFMNSTMSSASSAMASTPSSGGGGGFTGGGFSGGGGGGGGGGSW